MMRLIRRAWQSVGWALLAETTAMALVVAWAMCLSLRAAASQRAREEFERWGDALRQLEVATLGLAQPGNEVFAGKDVSDERSHYSELSAGFRERERQFLEAAPSSSAARSFWRGSGPEVIDYWFADLDTVIRHQENHTQDVFEAIEVMRRSQEAGDLEAAHRAFQDAGESMAAMDRTTLQVVDHFEKAHRHLRSATAAVTRQRGRERTELHLMTAAVFLLAVNALRARHKARQLARSLHRSHFTLMTSVQRHRAILDNAADGMITINSHGIVQSYNAAAARIFGYDAAEIIGNNISLLMPSPDSESHDEHLSRFRRTGVKKVIGNRREVRGRRKDGSVFPMDIHVSEVLTEGQPFFTGIVRDLTQQKQIEEALLQANEKLATGLWEMEQQSTELEVLAEMGQMLQTCLSAPEAHETIASYAVRLFPDWSGQLCLISATGHLSESVASWGDRSVEVEPVFAPCDCWALRKGRQHVAVASRQGMFCQHLRPTTPAVSMCLPMTAGGELLGVFSLQLHSTGGPLPLSHATSSVERLAQAVASQTALTLSNLQLREKLGRQAIRDPLTGLFNRRHLQEMLERELRRAARKNVTLGVIMVDIDHFKRFNDTYGHAAGDALLCQFSTLLKNCIRNEDIACRYGGEEFAIVLPEATPEVSMERAEQIRLAIQAMTAEFQGQPLGAVTASLGVALFPEQGRTPELLLSFADAALYQAKRKGRDRVEYAGRLDEEPASDAPTASYSSLDADRFSASDLQPVGAASGTHDRV